MTKDQAISRFKAACSITSASDRILHLQLQYQSWIFQLPGEEYSMVLCRSDPSTLFITSTPGSDKKESNKFSISNEEFDELVKIYLGNYYEDYQENHMQYHKA